MIGIISKKSEQETVKEFFELFKTPWEFYQDDHLYDVVISTREDIPEICTTLLVIYRSEKTGFDSKKQIHVRSQKEQSILEWKDRDFPIYGKVLTFDKKKKPVINVKGTDEAVGIEINTEDKKILRIGIDLFQEISFLLSSGQPAEFAHIPTLEIYISMLRDWILTSGIPLVEIPPVPAGYDFISCLTHDVDFVGIRNHKLDHTMFGFVYRALFGSLIGILNGTSSWQKLLKNCKAVFLLPGVYLGFAKDFWIQFDRYMEIENDLGATFFFLPFKDRPGHGLQRLASKLRASRYSATDFKQQIKRLNSQGCEIGLHGIDAWQDSEKGREEFEHISSIVGRSDIGIRMHWLYFNKQSPENLEKAGFLYDSTLGYNDAVGYRAGTLQVFRFPGAKRLSELPLHIQDTALFYPKRMNLTESKALDLVKKLMKDAREYGGVLTINWHHRSIGPERLWDGFYIRCLEKLKGSNVWFARAVDVIRWFHKRRTIFFEDCEFTGNSFKLKLSGNGSDQGPSLLLRIHRPNQEVLTLTPTQHRKRSHFDLPIGNKSQLEISL